MDIYLLKLILHDWDDPLAVTILQNCCKGMTPDSKILLIEKIIEDNDVKQTACLGDINMLMMYNGRERTLKEFENLLSQANLKLTRTVKINMAFSIIEAVRK